MLLQLENSSNNINVAAKGDGVTALMRAAQKNHEDIVELLINAKSDIHVNMQTSTDGSTALKLSIEEDPTIDPKRITNLLLQAGSYLNLHIRNDRLLDYLIVPCKYR